MRNKLAKRTPRWRGDRHVTTDMHTCACLYAHTYQQIGLVRQFKVYELVFTFLVGCMDSSEVQHAGPYIFYIFYLVWFSFCISFQQAKLFVGKVTGEQNMITFDPVNACLRVHIYIRKTEPSAVALLSCWCHIFPRVQFVVPKTCSWYMYVSLNVCISCTLKCRYIIILIIMQKIIMRMLTDRTTYDYWK